jgi:hypothetical protein
LKNESTDRERVFTSCNLYELGGSRMLILVHRHESYPSRVYELEHERDEGYNNVDFSMAIFQRTIHEHDHGTQSDTTKKYNAR